ncbi:hypothetical protein CHS0354_019423 [Potamilus streckersoni]|uniref:glucosamine-phosphate N-acetyltransferase n=1 Tax=Potamilus streckersoni TaxID=2493646 RepID=A0AAE0SIL4_9BIVA|nr:hypothetical protein CHS0354_019423 [Potamilus streckersoni]
MADNDKLQELVENTKSLNRKGSAEKLYNAEDDCFTRPGAQLSDKVTFENRKGGLISGCPVIVDFRRLLQLSRSTSLTSMNEWGVIPGVSDMDLLHAVVGLYDVSLSEMTPDVLYSTVCERWARTIILLRDVKEALQHLEDRRKKEEKENDDGDDDDDENCVENKGNELSAEEDMYEVEESEPSKFADVYSDTESEEEESEEDNEEDFSKGMNSFIKSVLERRKNRKTYQGPFEEEHVGIENRIIGCITFEKKYVRSRERVVHLTLVSVRRRYRKYGIGKFLLSQIVDPAVVGHYDAIVVHADNAAVDFFRKFGFSDDVVLNSRWSEFAEQFTNCTMMCYLPGFSGHRLLSTIKLPSSEMFELEQEFNKWKEKTIEVYQQQVICMTRMKHEALQLKYMNITQNQLMEYLAQDVERLKREKFRLEKEFLEHRLSTARTSYQTNSDLLESPDDEISTEELINDLQRQLDRMDLSLRKKKPPREDSDSDSHSTLTIVGESRYLSFPSSEDTDRGEPYDHIKDAKFFYDASDHFKQAMKLDKSCSGSYEITTISKALLPEEVKKKYSHRVQELQDPTMIIDLYFCGSLERPETLQTILKQGFSESDLIHGDFGKGLYFSKYPSKAAQFSAIGKLLKVEVGLGNTETVVKADKTRKGPKSGFDSIITPGRLIHKLGEGDTTMNQEYVIFDINQVLPLCLISYEVT